jgi:hypothetical protein
VALVLRSVIFRLVKEINRLLTVTLFTYDLHKSK